MESKKNSTAGSGAGSRATAAAKSAAAAVVADATPAAAAAVSTYTVLGNIKHSGKRYRRGSEKNPSTIELTGKEASPLLRAGVIQ